MKMIKKGTKLYSITHLKCPRCHEGDLFLYKNPYSLSKFDKMPDYCSVCQQKFEPETGFYYGSMYVSYALSVAISVSIFVAMYTFFNLPLWLYLVINALVLLLLVPITFRLSRALWINFMIKYNPDYAKKDAVN